ncbi:GNAT family N-acetyltransferase [Pseudomonas serboccidentalis]|uniref:GNAT family N-acetyltransferase n=1 Tax=Pseudomonas serboccidentalis TaxID=2964670 RepID=A0ABY7Z7I3_9PSED|nr:GNAT family N-acetyltransferase [Pseudomonas serboccidentalis]WDR35542.1 GNAT family N-acetyltransferase [Pseudomonas serboccidentalis]
MSDFDRQPVLCGSTLRLRPLADSDFEGLYLAASDPFIWVDHPACDRHERQVFAAYFAARLATGQALAVIDIESGQIVGTSSFYIPPDLPESIAIGYTFLIRAKWGGEANRELKRLMVEHAFETYDTVYLHIAPSNIRSQKAALKIGAVHLYDAELRLSATPALCKCYGLTRAQWALSHRNNLKQGA